MYEYTPERCENELNELMHVMYTAALKPLYAPNIGQIMDNHFQLLLRLSCDNFKVMVKEWQCVPVEVTPLNVDRLKLVMPHYPRFTVTLKETNVVV